MAITKQKKGAIIDTLRTELKDTQTVVFVHFKKLPVSDTMALRRKLRGVGVGYKVSKKTLIKRVMDEQGITGTWPELEGEVAIAYSADQLAPAREVYAFAKEHKDQVKIVGGVWDGVYQDQNYMMTIATIPSREVLLTQLVGLLQSPIRGIAVALSQIAGQKA